MGGALFEHHEVIDVRGGALESTGLTLEQVQLRRKTFGLNSLPPFLRVPLWRRLCLNLSISSQSCRGLAAVWRFWRASP